MKIGAVLLEKVTSGGGYCQALSAILQMQRLSEGRFEFVVFVTESENLSPLKDLGVTGVYLKRNRFDRLLSYGATNDIARRLQSKLRFIGSMESSLINEGVDLVYFVSPSSLALSLQKLNYIMTVWDTCHRDTPEFPEVREYASFHIREWLYRNVLGPATLTLTDSQDLADSISLRYNVDAERLLAMPFSPSPLLSDKVSTQKEEVVTKYNLEEGYFFYPSQMWAHKNHIRILQAMAILKEKGIEKSVVFAGGNKGNLSHVQESSRRLGVSNYIRFLSFVPAADIRGLYLGSCALVMPTYFGPTNLPPMEAWELGIPVIYSSQLKNQVGDAALTVDPNDKESLANAMIKIMAPKIAAGLVKQGRERLSELKLKRLAAEEKLLQMLNRFSKIRECWE